MPRRDGDVFRFGTAMTVISYDLVIPALSQRVRPEVAGPMTGYARNPESILPVSGLWIPDWRFWRAPE
jgi:hypothetical protein